MIANVDAEKVVSQHCANFFGPDYRTTCVRELVGLVSAQQLETSALFFILTSRIIKVKAVKVQTGSFLDVRVYMNIKESSA